MVSQVKLVDGVDASFNDLLRHLHGLEGYLDFLGDEGYGQILLNSMVPLGSREGL